MKKSVLFVINTFSKGGAEVALLELLKHIDLNRYEIDLFVLMGQGELVSQLPPEIRLINHRYDTTSVLTSAGKKILIKNVIRAALCRGNVFRLFGYMVKNWIAMLGNENHPYKNLIWRMMSDGAERQDKEYDLAVAFLEGGSSYYVSDHVKAKRKATYVHVDYQQAGYTRELDLNCYLSFDHLFMVSKEVQDKFVEIYPELEDRCSIFYNIINHEMIFKKAIEDEGFLDAYNGIRLLTVGRLHYQKGYDIAIQAMQLLKRRNIHARWYVLGDGSLRDKLAQQIHSAGLDDDFILMGAVTNPYPYYEQCDIYVHATRYEGKSIAIQEAMILGCPVIASNCVGNRETVEDGVNGILCELTPEGIADAIEDLILDKNLRMKYSARAAAIRSKEDSEVHKLMQVLNA
ncbi:MAG: glycosyltransferase [Lachnospiraceae bacterium]|nr:glycosyltransferase [Lachnospiraceae bacterium]